MGRIKENHCQNVVSSLIFIDMSNRFLRQLKIYKMDILSDTNK